MVIAWPDVDLYKPFDDIIIGLSKENQTTISKVLFRIP
jgi:hypothetical protein